MKIKKKEKPTEDLWNNYQNRKLRKLLNNSNLKQFLHLLPPKKLTIALHFHPNTS